jgi:hypothetical protein
VPSRHHHHLANDNTPIGHSPRRDAVEDSCSALCGCWSRAMCCGSARTHGRMQHAERRRKGRVQGTYGVRFWIGEWAAALQASRAAPARGALLWPYRTEPLRHCRAVLCSAPSPAGQLPRSWLGQLLRVCSAASTPAGPLGSCSAAPRSGRHLQGSGCPCWRLLAGQPDGDGGPCCPGSPTAPRWHGAVALAWPPPGTPPHAGPWPALVPRPCTAGQAAAVHVCEQLMWLAGGPILRGPLVPHTPPRWMSCNVVLSVLAAESRSCTAFFSVGLKQNGSMRRISSRRWRKGASSTGLRPGEQQVELVAGWMESWASPVYLYVVRIFDPFCRGGAGRWCSVDLFAGAVQGLGLAGEGPGWGWCVRGESRRPAGASSQCLCRWRGWQCTAAMVVHAWYERLLAVNDGAVVTSGRCVPSPQNAKPGDR